MAMTHIGTYHCGHRDVKSMGGDRLRVITRSLGALLYGRGANSNRRQTKTSDHAPVTRGWRWRLIREQVDTLIRAEQTLSGERVVTRTTQTVRRYRQPRDPRAMEEVAWGCASLNALVLTRGGLDDRSRLWLEWVGAPERRHRGRIHPISHGGGWTSWQGGWTSWQGGVAAARDAAAPRGPAAAPRSRRASAPTGWSAQAPTRSATPRAGQSCCGCLGWG